MKKLIKIVLLTGLILASSAIKAMEQPNPASQSIPTTIKVGLYGSPEMVNFLVIKKAINQLRPEDLQELNAYDDILDGTVLDIVEDRKNNYPGYDTEYNEIIKLLKDKGAQTAGVRQHSNENLSIKL